MKECIFCKIRDGKIPTKFTYQDDEVMVFPDIHPIKPIHLLIVPRKHIPEFLAVSDLQLFPKLCQVIQKMIKEKELDRKGYRIIINGGGAQEIEHLHIHLIGPMGSAAAL